MTYQLAQINVAKLRYPMDDPRIADFANNLERINAVAESAPGFVWRLQDDSGNATHIRAYDDPLIIVNMSVWQSLEALQAFAYRTEHVQFFRRRSEWFEDFGAPYLALWWIAAGAYPTPHEGRKRLDLLAARGPSPEAFTFRERFARPNVLGAAAE
jgi:hypothetical protein